MASKANFPKVIQPLVNHGLQNIRRETDERARENDHLDNGEHHFNDKARHIFLRIDEIVNPIRTHRIGENIRQLVKERIARHDGQNPRKQHDYRKVDCNQGHRDGNSGMGVPQQH